MLWSSRICIIMMCVQFCDWRLSVSETDSACETFAYHDEDSVDIYAGLQDTPEKNTDAGKNCLCVLIQWALWDCGGIVVWCFGLLFEEYHFNSTEMLLGAVLEKACRSSFSPRQSESMDLFEEIIVEEHLKKEASYNEVWTKACFHFIRHEVMYMSSIV